MKKLLAVATIGVVGYLVVKKIKERKNNEEVEVQEMEVEEVVEETIENVADEIVIDDEEPIRIENVEIIDVEEVDEENVISKMFNTVKARVLVPITKLGIVVAVYVKCVVEVNKEEKDILKMKQKIVNKFKQDYHKYMNR